MKELHKLQMVIEYEAKKVKAKEAAEVLGISVRQFRRLVVGYRQRGAEAFAHGNRGKPPTNRISDDIRQKILNLAQNEYRDYNDCHFTEELANQTEPIDVSRSTVRRIRRANGLGSPRKKRAPRHRSRRERKAMEGMLLQADGSRHDWLEGRGPKLTLIGMMDDATNEFVGACFREEEDAAGYFMVLQQVCMSKGLPQAIYADRHTIFQSPSTPTIEQELNDEVPRTQFGRLLDELGIQLIAAHSPQAKGRVERLWGTLQDRLVKELRKANASDLESANRVLANYLPKYNARFRVEAPNPTESAYIPWPDQYDPDHHFCFKYTRKVMNDNTISFDGHRLQIPPQDQHASLAKAKVELHHYMDGSLSVFYKGQKLVTFQPANPSSPRVEKFQPANLTPPSPKTPKPKTVPKQRAAWKPPADHPWRRPLVAKETK